MSQRLLSALPYLIAVALLAVAAPEPMVAVFLAFALLVGVLIGPKIPFDAATQRLATAVIVILVIAGVRAAGLPAHGHKLGAFAFGCALAPLCVVAFRQLVEAVEGGGLASLVIGFVSMMAMGATPLGALYGAAVTAYLAATLFALRLHDRARVAPGALPRTAAVASAAIVALACGFALLTAKTLRPLQQLAQSRIDQAFQHDMLSRVMFSDSMRLGKMTQMLESNRIVLRVRGPRVDWLRGAVLDRYDGGSWLRAGGGRPVQMMVGRGPIAGNNVVELRKVGDDGDRLFLPFDLAALSTPNGIVMADPQGIARIGPEVEPIAWFSPGPRTVLPISDATDADLQMPADLRGPLTWLANEWRGSVESREEALAIFEHRFHSEFQYSTTSERKTRLDPVVDFLFKNRVGHCEYFASAMALMARTIGVPARVVTGYRVAERNPILGHYVVRERNAHAWVEAWLPGRGWVRYDPTPLVELPFDQPHEESGVTALSELVTAGAGRIESWLAERTVTELSIAAGLGFAIFVVVRLFGKKVAPVDDREFSAALAFSAPLPAYQIFEARLAQRGLARTPGEPLERFAERLPEPARDLVHRYASTRYGGIDDAALDADLRAGARPE